jgi:hypothetical protein
MSSEDELETALHKALDSMRGQLAGLIESWGLRPTQERGAINTMKTLSYNAEAILVELIKQ